jgi:nucleoside-diphosphate-sugar epimerase
MKILVTGATGFIGSHLTQNLINQGYEVKILVRSSSDTSFFKSSELEIIEGDIQDKDSLEKAMKDTSLIYHCVAQRTKPKTPKQAYYLVNVEGGKNLAEVALSKGVARLVFLSTVGVYGGKKKDLTANENTPPNPNTYYRTTKLISEQDFLKAYQEKGLPVVIARLSGVCGVGSTTWLGLVKAIASSNFRLIGDGDNYYYLGHVSDIIRGLILCGETPNIEGNIYNLGGKKPIKLRDLVQIIADTLGVKCRQKHLPAWPYQSIDSITEWVYQSLDMQLPIHHRYDMFLSDRRIDISKAIRELNYHPQVSNKEAIRELVNWYQEQNYIKSYS